MTAPDKAFPDGWAARDLGTKHEANHKLGAQPPPFDGHHLWVVISAWRVANPARAQYILDMENLLTMSGPCCYWCEHPWLPTVGSKCPGDPT